MRPPPLREIARRLQEHLRRIEADNSITGIRLVAPTVDWYGHAVFVSYVGSDADSVRILRLDAVAYLAWLDAGNVGRHTEMLAAAIGDAQ